MYIHYYNWYEFRMQICILIISVGVIIIHWSWINQVFTINRQMTAEMNFQLVNQPPEIQRHVNQPSS